MPVATEERFTLPRPEDWARLRLWGTVSDSLRLEDHALKEGWPMYRARALSVVRKSFLGGNQPKNRRSGYTHWESTIKARSSSSRPHSPG